MERGKLKKKESEIPEELLSNYLRLLFGLCTRPKLPVIWNIAGRWCFMPQDRAPAHECSTCIWEVPLLGGMVFKCQLDLNT
jgi:hypothetical protein